jgi:hypothetical protein
VKNLRTSPIACLFIITCIFCSVHAGQVFVQPTDWYIVQPSDTNDKTAEIQAAIKTCRQKGGGTVYLPAGTFIISSPIKIQTDYHISSSDQFVIDSAVPFNVRLCGAIPITGHTIQSGETVIKWNGTDSTAAVIDISSAQNTTIENIRITTFDSTRRFRYGVFFHRIESGNPPAGYRPVMPAPTAVNLIDCGITKGPGSFTCGYRINDPMGDARHPDDPYFSTDQNCDMNYIENLWIQGASDDNGGTTTDYQDGINSCGLWVDGSQVQAGYFRNLNIDNCGTGVYANAGQIEVFGGTFSNNIQPAQDGNQCMAYDNFGSDTHSAGWPTGGFWATGQGGGDFVFRIPFGGGHVIQDVTSTGSYRFITGYLEDGTNFPSGSLYPSGVNAQWQGDSIVCVAVVGCSVLTTAHPAGEVVFVRDNGGPWAFNKCNFGGTSGTAQKIVVGQWTQGSVFVTNCKFNHSSGTFYSTSQGYVASGEGASPRIAIVDSQGWDGASYVPLTNMYTDNADSSYQSVTFDYDVPRSRSTDMPVITNGYLVDLNIFTYNGHKCRRDGYLPVGYDNGTIINAAIAAVKSNGGGTVWFPSGSYVVTVPILLQDVNGVRLMGTGGRDGVRQSGGGTGIAGTEITWDGDANGTVLTINRSSNVILKGIHFSVWGSEGDHRGLYAIHCNTFILISQTGSGGYPTQNIWLDDTSCGFDSGSGQVIDEGICKTFINIGSGAGTQNCNHITALCVSAGEVEDASMLINGSASTDIKCMQFGGVPAKRVIHVGTGGGAFSWFGGGAGNNLYAFNSNLDPNYQVQSDFTDPVAVELENATGPIYMAGHEFQDNYPTRLLRTSTAAIDGQTYPGAGKVVMYGEDFYFAAPKDDHKQFDFKFTGTGANRPELYLYGCAVGWAMKDFDANNPENAGYGFALYTPELAIANGSVAFCAANAYAFKADPAPSYPWNISDDTSFMQDISSRGSNADQIGNWPWDRPNWKFFNSSIAIYSLSPYVVTAGSQFKVTWRMTGPYTPLLGGDSDLDGVVTWNDLAILGSNWCTGSGATWKTGDSDNNGKIDFADFAALAANWLTAHQITAGDWVGIFQYPSSTDAINTTTAKKDLVNDAGVAIQSGTTRDYFTAPSAGLYELRYWKGAGLTKCVCIQILKVQ